MATINKIDLNGDVYDIESSYIVTIQPANPTEGATYYDITNNVVKVYDGTNWVEVGKEYSAGEGIAIGQGLDYSAMRGPCDEGFHIPLENEGRSLCSIIQNLGLTWNPTNIGIYLKLADYGFISNTGSKDTANRRSCWTAECGTDTASCIMPRIDASGRNIMGISGSCALPIRPFKDEPVIPDNTWTTLYTSDVSPDSRNIKHSQSLGLITISYDGTYITIADKNLGATVVYNNGDTYNQNNIGYCYQRGNNYGFEFASVPSSGRSSEKVDVSSYSPGEYNSNIFVTAGIGSSRWINSNGDLRGGDTGVVTIDNVISNTGVLSVNGQTGHVIVESGGKQSFFKTQDEYDALPASKESDGNLYIIVDSHIHLLTPPELYALGVAAGNSDNAIIAELNTHPAEYMEFAISNGWGQKTDFPGVPAGKTLYTGEVWIFDDPNGGGVYVTLITDMEENEFITLILNNIPGATQEVAEQLWEKRNTYTTDHSAFPK